MLNDIQLLKQTFKLSDYIHDLVEIGIVNQSQHNKDEILRARQRIYAIIQSTKQISKAEWVSNHDDLTMELL